MKRIALVVGTRPEAIKLGPVYRALANSGRAEPTVILSGQHGDILDPLIELFGLDRRIELGVLPDGDLVSFGGRLMSHMGRAFDAGEYDVVAVQGDTTSALIGAIVAAYQKRRVAHVEAGLRTPSIAEPFPEELNRRVISRAAHWHFAPTIGAADNLRRDATDGEILVVGNTVVDAALWTAAHRSTSALVHERFPTLRLRKYVVVTAHRRESFGPAMHGIAAAVAKIATRHPEFDIILPLHPNPNASDPFKAIVGEHPNVFMTEPLPYQLVIGLIAGAYAILTDSGGLQEEAPSFGVPVLVLREVTERPEGIAAGCSVLVGTAQERILDAFEMLVRQGLDHDARLMVGNPYGDGRSADRIAAALLEERS